MILEAELAEIEGKLAEIDAKVTAESAFAGPLADQKEVLEWDRKRLELPALKDPAQSVKLDKIKKALAELAEETESHKKRLSELRFDQKEAQKQRRDIIARRAVEESRVIELELCQAWQKVIEMHRKAAAARSRLGTFAKTAEEPNGGAFYQAAVHILSAEGYGPKLPGFEAQVTPWPDQKADEWLRVRIAKLSDFFTLAAPAEPGDPGPEHYLPVGAPATNQQPKTREERLEEFYRQEQEAEALKKASTPPGAGRFPGRQ